MHAAMLTQAGSFGHAVGPAQQNVATQLAHDDPGVVKIWFAPVHAPVPASTTITTAASRMPPSRGGEDPPPATGPLHGIPLTVLQGPSCCGFSLDDEHAKSAPSAPAVSTTPRRTSGLALPRRGESKDERKAMAKVFCGL
jgi:hypothetical protein